VPLAGTTLTRTNGTANEILRVDDGGIERRSSNGRTQRIEIEIFRWAIERLLRGATVTRDEINVRYPGRASSGIMLILSQIPLFESVAVGRKQALRQRRTPGT
jgi:restriction system protein